MANDSKNTIRTSSTLELPVSSPVPRRPSPRVEDMMRSPRKAQRTRQRIAEYQTFDDAVNLLQNSQNIVVLTGAGISTSVGIPDFRSDKGLYNKLSKIGITQPEDFFSMSYFQENPEDFFKYVREVVPTAVPSPDGTYRPVKRQTHEKITQSDTVEVPRFTPTHAFLSLLQSKGKLLTNYTQNIDGLERAAGLPNGQFIQCHGSWDTATCLTCGKTSSARKYLPVVHSGSVPYCKCFNEAPPLRSQQQRKKDKPKAGKKRKRANSFSDHSSDDGTKPPEPPQGLLKPDLVFFEEKITPLYHSRLESDRPRVDLLVIIGTSLKVAPIQYMLFKIRPNVPQIYISKERFSGALCSLPGVQVDIELLGECDLIIEELCRRAGWQSSLRKLFWQEGQKTIQRVKSNVQAKGSEKSSTQLSLDPEKLNMHKDRGTDESTSIIPNIKVENAPEITQSGVGDDLKTRTTNSQSNHTDRTYELECKDNPAYLEVESSNVKVELVEGTEHQWRIVRKK